MKKNTREADDPIYINTIKSIRINKVVINKGPQWLRVGRQQLWLLAFGGNLSTRIPLGGWGWGHQSPPDTGTSGSRKTWGGGQWGPIIHSIGQGIGGGRFTASLKFATFFERTPEKDFFPQHHKHRALSHTGDLPQREVRGVG